MPDEQKKETGTLAMLFLTTGETVVGESIAEESAGEGTYNLTLKDPTKVDIGMNPQGQTAVELTPYGYPLMQGPIPVKTFNSRHFVEHTETNINRGIKDAYINHRLKLAHPSQQEAQSIIKGR